jgi:hypothetical protein
LLNLESVDAGKSRKFSTLKHVPPHQAEGILQLDCRDAASKGGNSKIAFVG